MSPGARGAAAIAAALGLAAALPAGGAAQGWIADLSAGRVADQAVSAAARSSGAAFFLRYDGVRWGYAGGGAALDSVGASWLAAGAGGRLARPLGVPGLAAGVDLAARGFAYAAHASAPAGGGLTLEAMPLLAAQRGGVQGALRAGVLHFSATPAADSASRTLFASDLRLETRRGGVTLGAEGRWWHAPEGGYPYLGASARSEGRVSAWGEAGAWLTSRVDRPVWSAGASLRVLPATELYLAAGQETNDPLYRLAPRVSWSVGVSRRLGRAAAAPAPLPLSAPARIDGGAALFRLPAVPGEPAPALGGDFNQWRPQPMALEGDAWVLRLPLPSGVYHYAFRRGGGAWFVPPGTPGRGDDGFGGVSAVLLVP